MLELWQIVKRKKTVSAVIKWRTNKGYDLYHYTIFANGREKIRVKFYDHEWENLDLDCNQINTLYKLFMQALNTAGKLQ